MKNSSRQLLIVKIIALTLISLPSFAQIKYGPKIGLNFSELPDHTEFIVSQQIYSGYHLGGEAEYRLSDKWFVQAGVLISRKGSRYIVGNNADGNTKGFTNFWFSCFYVDIPVDMEYKFDFHKFNIIVLAGPQIGYGLSGKWTAYDKATSEVHFGKDPNDDFKPFDYGFNIGGGLEYGRFQITSQFYLGLRTLSAASPQLKEKKFKTLSVSVAYLFGKNKKDYGDYNLRYLNRSKTNKGHRK